ncbi:MAG: TraR/DksA C4-type zinc finger protein, partial [candidate division NC10 bacterium]|nr:TraR/DksA C4-type zinc finger protein [candidate division NC10 bacterium]
MARNRKRAPSKWALATQFLTERRATRQRLAALDRRHSAHDPGRAPGLVTARADVIEEVQEAVAKQEELAAREVLVARLKALARAEQKIREGTYGRCDACGRPIPPLRLQVVSEASHCVPCAEQWERGRP